MTLYYYVEICYIVNYLSYFLQYIKLHDCKLGLHNKTCLCPSAIQVHAGAKSCVYNAHDTLVLVIILNEMKLERERERKSEIQRP